MEDLRAVLEAVREGRVSVEEALLSIKKQPFEDIGYAKVDLHRRARQGAAEVIYGAGKTAEQITGIIRSLTENGESLVLITRLDAVKAARVSKLLARTAAGRQYGTGAASGSMLRPDGSGAGLGSGVWPEAASRCMMRPERSGAESGSRGRQDGAGTATDFMAQTGAEPEFMARSKAASGAIRRPDGCLGMDYHADARIGIVGKLPEPDGQGRIVVATGGTSDIPVAEEAALTAEAYGNEVVRIYDVGVSGLHRLLSHMDDIMGASVIIAIAGMEGALASVIGGLADCPVIAVPTSVGYGASFGGISALLSMLNSCASGVAVVNIDNGFGAGYLASMINHPHRKLG